MPREDLDAAMYARAREYLPGRGYRAYEISNFARDGKACRHNLHYWRIKPYLGFGPSAHSFDGARRSWNVRSLDEYMTSVDGGASPAAGEEVLGPVQLHNEKLAFGLRLSGGVSVTTDLGYGSVPEFARQFEVQLERWTDHLVLSGDRLSLTEQGIFLADTIAADLLLEGGSTVSARVLRPPTAPAGS
ncbi:unnamed protein product [marine sediment metagenome]|uniref:HemN C-terminal domain-containing protein n=1 Tax=marine sediment metagenome TaxID=412755 RepID=X0SU84_9ZZZZ